MNNTYFELQTLYVLHQIGLLGLLIFYALVYYQVARFGREALVLFTIYLIYTFWNPYCFDTTEMLTLIMLANYEQLNHGEKDNKDKLFDASVAYR